MIQVRAEQYFTYTDEQSKRDHLVGKVEKFSKPRGFKYCEITEGHEGATIYRKDGALYVKCSGCGEKIEELV